MNCHIITPDIFWSFNCPIWKEIKITLPSPYSYIKLSREIERYGPDIINIMTEGPLGIMASIHCNINGRLYTTMRCSRFDLYLEHYICKPVGILCRMFLDWFHSWSHCCITPSPSMAKLLKQNNPNIYMVS